MKPMAPAFSEEGKAALPTCRGWHPHLRVAPLEECTAQPQPITLGATNMWFSRTAFGALDPIVCRSVGTVGRAGSTALFEDAESEREVMLARKGQARYDPYTDAQIWEAVQKLRCDGQHEPLSPKDLKLPEWKLFSKPDPRRTVRICGCG